MSRLGTALLDLDCAWRRLRGLKPGPAGAELMEAARAVGRAGARLEAAAVAASIGELEPLQAVELAIVAACRSGVDWDKVVATVSRARP